MAPSWTVDEDDSRDGVPFIPINAPGLFAAEVYGSADDLSITDEDRSRARLIAASPALLEAAKLVLAGLHARIEEATAQGKPVPVFAGIALLHDAIALATGAHQ